MINVAGISESRVAPVAAHFAEASTQSFIVVASSTRAKRLATDLSFFAPERPVYVLPEEEHVFLRYEARDRAQTLQRLQAMKVLLSGAPAIIIAPATAAVRRLLPPEVFASRALSIRVGDTLSLSEVRARLVELGYVRAGVVDGRGVFSLRGGILDVFTPDATYPYRIELFDTEVDSIRAFDMESQRSVENLQAVDIYPASELLQEKTLFQTAAGRLRRDYTAAASRLEKKEPEIAQKLRARRDELCDYMEQMTNVQLLENYLHYFCEETAFLWDYMRDGCLMVDDPDRIGETLELASKEASEDLTGLIARGQAIRRDEALLPQKSDLLQAYRKPNVCVFTPFPKAVPGAHFDAVYNLESRQVLSFHGKMNMLETELVAYARKGYRICIVCTSEERIANLSEFIDRIGLSGRVSFALGTLTAGIDLPQQKVCYISERDIFDTRKTRHRQGRYKDKGQKLRTFSDMQPGDYVVHENHGIGRFVGIEPLTVQGTQRDYIKISYAGDDILYVPVEQMDMVQKYIGGNGAPPRMNKLAGGEWKQTKARAKAAIAVMAKDLIDLYARRQLEQGYAFGPDTIWQREFEDSFPFQETDDQLRAIEEIKADMEKPICMDRLLCGDVGFGKTEVAARAMFKCVADGRQAAVLVPTTILANQHYYTLKERFENFPFKVEVLSRFRSEREQQDVIRRLRDGQVDLVIGTHRLLSADVRFHDLGLLVVDEEQRFGVEHKEQIKKLKHNVDVLTLSATPIPRTLNMSLNGIKDMSLIEEPPEERYPVQTYVLEQDPQLIREVIERELGRGGQVFVVYNRVRGLQKIAQEIETLVPEANVAVGHGKMPEHALEDVMLSFINGETNVLVSTTIVESGIDIPNANTLIVLDADRYGLSQLYQLRGRVGRSNRIAYAYLMYQKDKVLTEVAEKRLVAIREFTEFGAGFKVAMRDLEIRGAGNLLGTEQSGHMLNIGYELYCRMVDEAVRALRGEVINETREDTTVELSLPAFIPDSYIEDESLKLQMYKKIADIHSESDEDDILDEMLDRFGDVPPEVVNLVKISRLRYLAESLSIVRISRATGAESAGRRGRPVLPGRLEFQFARNNPLSGPALLSVSERFGQRAFIHGGTEPFIRLTCEPRKMLDEAIELLTIIDDGRKNPSPIQPAQVPAG